MCGLKLKVESGNSLHTSHTLRGCVDWNLAYQKIYYDFYSHTLRGCVDWNLSINAQLTLHHSHTLRGCVDWNLWNVTFLRCGWVTPCVGVWIETFLGSSASSTSCHTLRGCVDWNIFWTHCKCTKRSHPAWVCGLKLGSLRRIHYGRCHTLRGCVDWNNDEVNTCIDNHSHTLRGCIWIEALFTRWSSLWKNCKHSASCVFLFKLL